MQALASDGVATIGTMVHPVPRGVVWSVLVLLTALGRAQCATQWIPGGDIPGLAGSGHAMASWDPDGPGPQTALLVVGGDFTHAVGTVAANLAAWDPATGVWSEFGGGCNGGIRDMLVLPTGELIVAGGFTSIGGTAVTGLARCNGTTWSPIGTGINAGVSCIALAPNGDLVIAGGFSPTGGVQRHVSRWDGTSWSALGTGLTGISSYPWDLTVLPNGDVVGVTPGYSGVTSGSVELWNGSAWTVIGSTTPPGIGPTGGSVETAVWAQGLLWVGGSFTHMNGAPIADSSTWDGTTWRPTGLPLPYVREFSIRPNGGILAAGVGFSSSSA